MARTPPRKSYAFTKTEALAMLRAGDIGEAVMATVDEWYEIDMAPSLAPGALAQLRLAVATAAETVALTLALIEAEQLSEVARFGLAIIEKLNLAASTATTQLAIDKLPRL